MAALIPFSEALRFDAELVRMARGASGTKYAIGAALEALAASGGHHELGFSSLEAYARERCERSGRWAADVRALARGLEALPAIRAALCAGDIGWSTAELLARHVSPETEHEWLERARALTVRELRALLAKRDTGGNEADAPHPDDDDADDATRSISATVPREDAWLFECTRKVAGAVTGRMSADRTLELLLAEGVTTLLELVPEGARGDLYDLERLERAVADEASAQAEWCAERRRWREEAEVSLERQALEFVECAPGAREREVDDAELSGPPEALDWRIRRLCTELANRDLALGIVAESARKAEIWRRFGFVSEARYARERLGISLSSLKAKRVLAARAERLPAIADALASRRIGYEAASLLSRVAEPRTVEEWLRRAERRTVKHLREEVEAAELVVRVGFAREQPPLDEQSLDELFELERSIVSGDVFERDGQMSGGEGRPVESKRGLELGTSAQKFGRVTLRFCVRDGTYRFFRALERAFVRVRARICRKPVSFLRFLCENFCRTWLPALRRARLTESGELPEYYGVYRRDAFRCSSPVCTRSDLTPHHLKFRSRGGGDEDENLATLCVWCHLHGVHEGRITAEPPASRIRWRIGRAGTLRVEGRNRQKPD